MISRERLMQRHAAGFNCAQCVASEFSDLTGMDTAAMLAAAGGFGGGFRSGDICGAASAAVMVLGLMYPHVTPNDPEEKAQITKLTMEFCKRFRQAYGYLDCRDLKGKGRVPCDELICGAAEILEGMLNEELPQLEEARKG